MIDDYRIHHSTIDFKIITDDGTTRTVQEFNEDLQDEINIQKVMIALNNVHGYLGKVSDGISDGIELDDYDWPGIMDDITRAEVALKHLKQDIKVVWKKEVDDYCYDS